VNRRDALLILAAVGATMPVALRAQPVRRVGMVRGGHHDWVASEFLQAMRNLGYREGRDLVFDDVRYRKQEDLPGLVQSLIERKPHLIVAASPPAILAARGATDRIPIVIVFSADPVATGLVKSLNRPGGNITGLTWDHGFDYMGKQLELLKETLPGLRRVAVLWDASDSVHPIYAKYSEQAASRLGLQLVSVGIRSTGELEAAFARIGGERAQALNVLPSAQIMVPQRKMVMARVADSRIPTLTGPTNYDYPEALLVMGPSQTDVPSRAARFADRILKGANPADLPIEQPTKYDLHVNLGVARKLHISVPQSVLVRADKVIE
jgi:putative ABC transport system substrate-binding protein